MITIARDVIVVCIFILSMSTYFWSICQHRLRVQVLNIFEPHRFQCHVDFSDVLKVILKETVFVPHKSLLYFYYLL